MSPDKKGGMTIGTALVVLLVVVAVFIGAAFFDAHCIRRDLC